VPTEPLLTTLEANKDDFSPETSRLYERAIRDFIAFAGGARKDWTTAAVQDWRKKLSASGLELNLISSDRRRRAPAPLSPQSVLLYTKAIRWVSRAYALRVKRAGESIAKYDFADGLKLKKEESKKNRYAIPESSAAAILNTCRSNNPRDVRDFAILVLGFRTGMRRSGMAGILLTDFKTSYRTKEAVVEIQLKGKRRWEVPLDAACIKAVNAWQDVLIKRYGVNTGPFFRAFKRNSDELVGPLTDEGIYEAVKKRARLAGVTGVTPHVMRHSFISYMVARGVPIYQIKRITGQLSDAIIDHYTTDLTNTSAAGILPKELG